MICLDFMFKVTIFAYFGLKADLKQQFLQISCLRQNILLISA